MSKNLFRSMASDAPKKRALFWLEFKAHALRRTNGRFLAKNEKRLENALKRSLDAQKKYIIDALKDLPELNQKGMRIVEKKGLLDNLRRMMEGLPKQKDMVTDMERYSGVVMLKAGTTTVRKFKLSEFGIDFTLRNAGAVRYMSDLRDLHLSNRFGSISNTTKQDVIEAVSDSILKGDTYGQVAGRISKMGEEGVFSPARAQRIAVNEIAKAYGYGNAQPLKEYKQRTGKQVYKSWVTVGDDLVSEICQANEKQGWILFDEAFSSGDLNEPAHINCRCAVAYKFDEGTGAGNEDESDVEQAKPESSGTLQTHVELRDGTTVNLPTGYAYHATPESNLESIAEEGLKPVVTRLDEGAKDPDARIYLGTNPAVTGTGVGMESGNPVLRVPASAISDPAKDPHIPNNLSIFTNEGIPADVIEIQDDNGNWISLADWMKLP
jgi:hypothetical protein